jgi:hypothetical protein
MCGPAAGKSHRFKGITADVVQPTGFRSWRWIYHGPMSARPSFNRHAATSEPPVAQRGDRTRSSPGLMVIAEMPSFASSHYLLCRIHDLYNV